MKRVCWVEGLEEEGQLIIKVSEYDWKQLGFYRPHSRITTIHIEQMTGQEIFDLQ